MDPRFLRYSRSLSPSTRPFRHRVWKPCRLVLRRHQLYRVPSKDLFFQRPGKLYRMHSTWLQRLLWRHIRPYPRTRRSQDRAAETVQELPAYRVISRSVTERRAISIELFQITGVSLPLGECELQGGKEISIMYLSRLVFIFSGCDCLSASYRSY